jgi:type VI secretion system secreted protein VgrG
MSIPVFFDHTRHHLIVDGLDLALDVVAFHGHEHLSQPFSYTIEFTSPTQDIDVAQILNRGATFTLWPRPIPKTKLDHLFKPKVQVPLRTLRGVVTQFSRVGESRDEARYTLTLQPRLALLDRGKQYCVYQQQSVPEIVKHILLTRHKFEHQDLRWSLIHDYSRRDQIIQFGESDLAFIQRLLAEVGIWYRFSLYERLNSEIIELSDDQRYYLPKFTVPLRPQSGLDSEADSVWNLQVRHAVVEQSATVRGYDHNNIFADLDSTVDRTRGAKTTHGEAYHYGEPHRTLGDPFDFDHIVETESGNFYARMRHERHLNQMTQLSGCSSSTGLLCGQKVAIGEGAPQAFQPMIVIVGLTYKATRENGLSATFEALPYHESICFRPPVPPKPCIAGSIPARVTSNAEYDLYGHIDQLGRYKVKFLFDRDTRLLGHESAWLRLARPYAGDTHGLHLPLIAGTEVAVAFEQGDPDKPYIAHALHDSDHPDLVTFDNYERNVLRTPANNKLRMEDRRGKEHIKLSTEHSGKSQLNLGHLVDKTKQLRGTGFELRSDGHGSLRAGKGLFISADQQTSAMGPQLEMAPAVARLQQASEHLHQLSTNAQTAGGDTADVYAQVSMMREQLDQLRASVALLSAPDGIGLTSGKHLQLAAADNLMLNAGAQADVSVVKRLFMGIGQGLSVFVNKLGIKLIANQGPVSVQAQNDSLQLIARHGLDITSTEDEIRITAKKRIVLNAGGSYFSLERCKIEAGTEGDYLIKGPYFEYLPTKAPLPKNLAPLPLPINPSEASQPQGAPAKQPAEIDPTILTDEALDEAMREGEEEEEEEELEEEEKGPEGITLRVGLFFDGTGNNLANAAAVAQCQREDAQSFKLAELEALINYCKGYGYVGLDEEGFAATPAGSYGNAPTNIAHLYGLYPDNTAAPIETAHQKGYVRVYIEGIGASSGQPDSPIAQGFGIGDAGVVTRVRQTPAAMRLQIREFGRTNPFVKVSRVEFDIFGFSRGAAAARHCANEILKSGRGIFAELLKPAQISIMPHFNPAKDVGINLIGLFDTVAAIGSLPTLNVNDDDNPGVNLYLPPGAARRVIQLTARDEKRHNFSLNSVKGDHLEIELPGVHSDLGGGYLPQARELLNVLKPYFHTGTSLKALQATSQWHVTLAEVERLRATGIADHGSIEVNAVEKPLIVLGNKVPGAFDFIVTTCLDRSVRGELSLISLRAMHQLAVEHGVPFEPINEQERKFKLPEDLEPIAARILGQIKARQPIVLDTDQERLLLSRYIHCSAHWNPVKVLGMEVMVNKPADRNQRAVHPHRPQKGYPQ